MVEWFNHLACDMQGPRMTLNRLVAAVGSLSVLFVALCSACSGGAPAPFEPMLAADATASAPAIEPPASPAPMGPVDAAVADTAPDGPFEYCSAQEARYAKCFPTTTFNRAQCKKREACLRAIYHPDLNIEGYLQCTSASCSGGGTSCLGYIDDHVADEGFKGFLASCKTRRDECGDIGPKQFEDACSPFAVMGLRDEVLAERATCLAEACTDIAECMEQKLVTRCGL